MEIAVLFVFFLALVNFFLSFKNYVLKRQGGFLGFMGDTGGVVISIVLLLALFTNISAGWLSIVTIIYILFFIIVKILQYRQVR